MTPGSGLQTRGEGWLLGFVPQLEVVNLVAADGRFERGGGVFDEDLAVVDDGETVAKLVGFFHVMGGEDDGNAFNAERGDSFPHRDAALRIEPGAGFVEEQNFGAMRDGAGDLEALGEPSAEGAVDRRRRGR